MYTSLATMDRDKAKTTTNPRPHQSEKHERKHEQRYDRKHERNAGTTSTPSWAVVRRYHDATDDERLYICVVLFESVVVAALALAAWGVMVSRISPSNKNTMSISVYMAIFVLARLFSLAYCLDAIRARNVVQLVLHIAFQFCMLTYAIAEIPQIRSVFRALDDPDVCVTQPNRQMDCLGEGSLYMKLQNILVWPPIITAFATVVYCILARRVYVQFGWDECRLLNASPAVKRIHRHYQTMVSLLKMLLFFASAFCMAYIILVTTMWKDRTEFIITIVALPIFYPTILVTGWALTQESAVIMVLCLIFLLAGEAYFIYKLASLWLPRTARLYSTTRINLAVFSVFAIILTMAVIVNGCLCISNFGKGLRSAHMERQRKASAMFASCLGRGHGEHDEEATAVEERLVID